MTASQFTIFQSLTGRKGLPQGRMADILGFEQTTLTRLLKPLEKRGLVLIEPNPKDRREKTVRLTKEGEALFKEAKTLWKAEQEKSLDELNDEEWQAVKGALRKLSEI
ncbi:MAG: MarR family transcriptional regulator [Pseudomonadota bacterium]